MIDVALIKNNAKVGSVIAANLTDEMKKRPQIVTPVATITSRSHTVTVEDTKKTSRGKDGYNIVSCVTICNFIQGRI